MSHHDSLRRKLKSSISDSAVAAAEAAVSGGEDGGELKRLDDLQKVLAALPESPARRLLPPLLIAIMCLAVASLAWMLRVPKTQIHVLVRTTALSTRVRAPLAWDGSWRIGGPIVSLRDVTNLDLPFAPGYSQRQTTHQSLLMRGGDIELNSLNISAGTDVSLIRDTAGNVHLFTSNGRLEGVLLVGGSSNVTDSSGYRLMHLAHDPPFTVPFSDTGRSAIPAHLRTSRPGHLALPSIPVDALSLVQEATDFEQQTSFASAITGGRLLLADTDTTIPINAGDMLHLMNPNGIISRLVVGKEGISLEFDGDVRDVSIGGPGFNQTLNPTWLDYLYHRNKLQFFWGAVTVLWGLLWSAKKLSSK